MLVTVNQILFGSMILTFAFIIHTASYGNAAMVSGWTTTFPAYEMFNATNILNFSGIIVSDSGQLLVSLRSKPKNLTVHRGDEFYVSNPSMGFVIARISHESWKLDSYSGWNMVIKSEPNASFALYMDNVNDVQQTVNFGQSTNITCPYVGGFLNETLMLEKAGIWTPMIFGQESSEMVVTKSKPAPSSQLSWFSYNVNVTENFTGATLGCAFKCYYDDEKNYDPLTELNSGELLHFITSATFDLRTVSSQSLKEGSGTIHAPLIVIVLIITLTAVGSPLFLRWRQRQRAKAVDAPNRSKTGQNEEMEREWRERVKRRADDEDGWKGKEEGGVGGREEGGGSGGGIVYANAGMKSLNEGKIIGQSFAENLYTEGFHD